MKPTQDKALTPKEIADNMRAISWYWEQQRKIALINLIPSDKSRLLKEAIDNALVLCRVARANIHAVEYYAPELTMQPVDSLRHKLDDVISKLGTFSKDTTLPTEQELFKLEDYPLVAEPAKPKK